MNWVSRNTRWALTAYCLLAVLILGGVTWGTILTIKIADSEQKQLRIIHNNDFDNTINSVAHRMESFFSAILLSEASRPYSDYFPYSHPHVFRPDGTKVIAESYVQPSPLISQDIDPWVRLHFQIDSEDGWQSPQVPPSQPFAADADIPTVDRVVAMEKAITLARLKQQVSYEMLEARINAYGQWAHGGDYSINEPTHCISSICLRPKHFEYRRRAQNLSKAQTRLLPPEMCEPQAVAQSNILDSPTYDGVDDPLIRLAVSPMSVVWLDPDETGREQLALLRSVRTEIQGLEAIQGVLLDWDNLKSEMLREAEEDLPDGLDLVPVRAEDAAHHKWLLATLPAAIRVPPVRVPELPKTSTYALIAFVWCAALAILGGVGLGIRNVLALAERRTQFAYAVTHELRTPLTTLRLYSDMLAGGLVRPEDRERYVQTLNTESERLSDLVDEVLEYARVENHKVHLDIKPVTVQELLRAVRDHCQTPCQKAGKELVIDVNGLAEKTVTTDPHLVRQVVANLVDNACKYSRDAADPTITLRVLPQHGDRISFDVQDHGPGIDPSQRHWVFKPFRRGRDDKAAQPGGIGLGLALARSWARLLRGRLDLVPNGAQTQGACFRLTIPGTPPPRTR